MARRATVDAPSSCSASWSLPSDFTSRYAWPIIRRTRVKYNPIEQCWGILEHHWNGALLDSLEAVIQYASTMTCKGKHPLVALVTTTYQTGVKLTKQAMQAVETQLQRLPDLDKWFVDIVYPSPGVRDV